MAEIVEYRIERTIHELEQLERYGILTKDEIKAVIKKRKAFEYRLQRNTRTKEDYLKYITYEENVLKLFRVRRDKLGLHSKTAQIETTIVNHIQSLYKTIVFKNQLDVQMWLSFIDFCVRHKSLAKVSSLYTRMLSVLNKKDWLWVRATKFEFEEHNSPETARNLFQRGIRFNPESRLLWHQYFKMELMFCIKIRKRRQILEQNPTPEEDEQKLEVKQSRDDVFNGKIASIVYQNAILAFDDFGFAADFLTICSQFDHKVTEIHKKAIYDDLKFRFSLTEELWDLMAKRIIEDGNDFIKSENLNKIEKKLKKREFERKTIGLYEQKIIEFNNQKMWQFYIKYRLEQLSRCLTEKKIRDKLPKVLDLIQRAWDQNCLTIEMFKEWIRLYFSCSDKYEFKSKIKLILLNGCDQWSDSLDVHNFCIPFVLKIFESKSEIKSFFEKILSQKLNETNDQTVDTLISIWEQYIQWAVTALRPIEVMNITKKFSKVCSDKNSVKLVAHMRPLILDALYSSYGLEKSRHFYHQFKKTPPNMLSFHQKMLEIETKLENPNHQLIRMIHEEIINGFGSNDSSLWINYIIFEIKSNPNNVANIHYKALKCLTPEECDQFIERYSLLKSNDFKTESDSDIQMN